MASTQIVPYQGSGSDYFPQPRRIGSAQRAQQKQQRRAAKKAAKPVFRSAATGYLTAKSVSFISRQAFNEDGTLTPSAETWLTRAVTVQRPVVLANLRRMRKSHPTFTNRQLAAQLDKEFKRSMTGGGALIGATSAVPGVGTVTSLGLSTLATGSFLELCAIYAQSMAELSGVSTEDPQKAKLLVMGVMLGDEGRRLLAELSAQADGRGAGPVGSIVPLSNLASSAGTATTMAGIVSTQLKKQFVRRFFVRQGTSMFGRAIPYGIGAVIGGIGNRALANQIVRSAHKTFGELPEETPEAVVEDFKRGLQREKLRADRKERRAKKKELKASVKAKRAARKQLQS
ncbi:hypothetical protein HGQ17_05350 [Nesterenkonia sp. MY13]|uniref:EcsC family protein n=1 Tax=Nesterenkonia sedimenti TaxID=1463632 RepID=A0A7X8YDR3_9MICC|nr:hypothetical protein [Nesterenkonia sedimenti]NLS09442.1 hypothetical protein [Nesterenkonia sedimenti]